MKFNKKLRFAAEYAGLRALIFALRLMPWVLAVKSGEIFGRLMIIVIPKRYQRAKIDIQKAFPNKTEKEIDAIAKESFINIGRMAAEFVKAVYMPRAKLLRRIEAHGVDKLHAELAKGKGVILHLGHFVNWEILGIWVGYMFDKVAYVAKPQGNPYTDKLINKMRATGGGVKISSVNPFFSCSKLIKKGYLVSILSDQSVYGDAALYMNFMGRAAEVGGLSALMALKLDAPVIPIRALRRNGKIVVEIEDPIHPPAGAQYSPQTLYDFTRSLNAIYERWISAAPQTWLWGHNRWKREKQSQRRIQAQNGGAL